MNKIASQLGLGGAVTEDDIVAAVRKLTDDKASAESRLAVEISARTMIETRMQEIEAEKLAAEQLTLVTKVDAEIEKLYASGRLPVTRDAAGNRVPHSIEQPLRDMAPRLGFAAFASYAASLPKVAPVADSLQMKRDVRPSDASVVLQNPDVRSMALAGGVTEDDIKKYNGLGAFKGGI